MMWEKKEEVELDYVRKLVKSDVAKSTGGAQGRQEARGSRKPPQPPTEASMFCESGNKVTFTRSTLLKRVARRASPDRVVAAPFACR